MVYVSLQKEESRMNESDSISIYLSHLNQVCGFGSHVGVKCCEEAVKGHLDFATGGFWEVLNLSPAFRIGGE